VVPPTVFIAIVDAHAAKPVPNAAGHKPQMPVIGLLSSYSSYDAFAHHSLAAFHQGLQHAEYVEGQNVAIEYRWAGNEYERLTALVVDLVRRRVR
jgi:putative ABC transport system substrate-binding protein